MKVLVTGATGFVGGALVRHLQASGHQVVATGRDRRKGEALGVPFYPAALDCPGSADAACAGCQAVVHAAALASPWGSAGEFFRHNVRTSLYLMESARMAKVQRVLLVSSSGVYFCGDDRLDVREDSPLPGGGQSLYVLTKRWAEEVIMDSGLDWVVVRPRAIYGPGDQVLLPRLLRLLGRGRLPIVGSGDNLTSLTHIDNLVQGLQLALESPEGQKIFNICDGPPVQLWELIRRVAEQLGLAGPVRRLPLKAAHCLGTALEWVYRGRAAEPPLTRYTVSLLGRSQTLNIEAAVNGLGYRPAFDTWEGVRRTLGGQENG